MALTRNGHFILQISSIQKVVLPAFVTGGNRNYSSDVKYLKNVDPINHKRGRGGRSSFSGNLVTVFGCSGFFGRYVCNLLGKHGNQMILPYRCPEYDIKHLQVMGDLGQILLTPLEMRDQDDLIYKTVRHSNVVVNLIGCPRFTSNWSLRQVNVEVAEKLARISKEVGVQKFIHISALNCDRPHEGYYQPGGSDFLKAKFESEEVVRNAFPEAIILRPSDVYGLEDSYLRVYCNVYRADFKLLGLVNGGYGIYKQPLYVGDIAEAIRNIVNHDAGEPGQTYQAVGPHRYELHDLMDWILRLQQRKELAAHRDYTHIVDLKYLLGQRFKYWINPIFHRYPARPITFEKIEREAISDELDPYLPTLVDLGVTPTPMESKLHRLIWKYTPYHMMSKITLQEGNERDARYTVPEY